jgi:hypothetical protein
VDLQNLAYALTQVIHNFGAVAVVGGAATALWLTPRQPVLERSLAWLVALAWAAQIISGVSLGAISFYYYGRFPDISGIATAALAIKITSADMAGANRVGRHCPDGGGVFALVFVSARRASVPGIIHHTSNKANFSA